MSGFLGHLDVPQELGAALDEVNAVAVIQGADQRKSRTSPRPVKLVANFPGSHLSERLSERFGSIYPSPSWWGLVVGDSRKSRARGAWALKWLRACANWKSALR